MKKQHVEYHSNNSGGRWWLSDNDWKSLEKNGWVIKWYPENGRFLGALATSAVRYNVSLKDAVSEWESATRQSAESLGCPCCGNPHTFTEYDENGKWVNSGPSFSYEATWE